MRVLEHLEPKEVFYYFEEICGIPHGSNNMKAISDYCAAFAKAHHLRYRQDEAYNVVIWKDATPGYENSPTVILQGHMDMVAVKTADCDLDMEKEGLRLQTEGDTIFAKQTSLGGDDGIAVAYALAVLASDTIPHPALEAVFTVNEEIGLLGATALDTSDLKGTILMNMDSEDDGIFLTSCAGGATAECVLPAPTVSASGVVYEISVEGLSGGHSGMAIINERANAICLLGRMLHALEAEKIPVQIGALSGGGQDNVIPKQCQAVVVIDAQNEQRFLDAVDKFEKTATQEYVATDPQLKIVRKRQEVSETEVLTDEAKQRWMSFLMLTPNGVVRRIPDMLEKVQTSLNLGILEQKNGEIYATYSVRSSVESEKENLLERLKLLTKTLGGHMNVHGVYPGWAYTEQSAIRNLMCEVYEEQNQKKPQLEAIHAGVECGIFCHKMPGLDCISYGPQMYDIHSVQEKLSISSVKRNWELTLEVLKRLK